MTSDLVLIAMSALMGISGSYIVWWIVTENGLREWPRQRHRRRYR